MKIKLHNILGLSVFLLAFSNLSVHAQQDQMNTQNMFNAQSINPAYAGTWKTVGFMANARQQLTDLDEVPESFAFSFQAPLRNEKSALGLNIINDKIGFEKQFYLFTDYSHQFRLSKTTNIRLGLKGGFSNYSNAQNSNVIANNQGAPEQNGINETMVNIGAGAYLYNKNYYVGLSMPRIINNSFENNPEGSTQDSELQYYYLMSGIIFKLGEHVVFKPTTLAKASLASESEVPARIDLSANFLIKEKFWVGAMYRTDASYGFTAQWIFKKNIRLGYAQNIINNVNNSHNGSHEIMVSYELASLKDNFGSLRYF